MLLIFILVLLLFGGSFGYYGHTAYGPIGAGGFGLGSILVIILIVYLLGGLRMDK